MKPGLGTFPTMPSALPMTRGCMRCHMSGAQREDPGTRNHFKGLPFLHGGVTCEAVMETLPRMFQLLARLSRSTRSGSIPNGGTRSASVAIWRAHTRSSMPAARG